MIKLIAMDMDGTLLNPQQIISPGNVQALQEASAAGIHICLCSGRMPDNLSTFAIEAGIMKAHIIALNGGCRLETPRGRILRNHFMKPETVNACKDIIDRSGVEYCVFHGDYIVQNLPFRSQEEFNAWIGRGKWKDNTRYGAGSEDVAEAMHLGLHKLVCIDRERPDKLLQLQKLLESQVDGIEITSSWHDNIEIMPKGVNKGTAVMELANELGLKREEVMTIGDNGNDLSMIEAAGIGVCMGNGVDELKTAADYVTGTNAQDGVAQAIYHLALKS